MKHRNYAILFCNAASMFWPVLFYGCLEFFLWLLYYDMFSDHPTAM